MRKKRDGYRVGQIWKEDCGDFYIVSQVDYSQIALICLDNGANRWTAPIHVVNICAITRKEWNQITTNVKLKYVGMIVDVLQNTLEASK